MSLVLPLLSWGSAVDLSAWADVTGTVGVTSSVADPFGGTGAYTYTDNDAGQAEGRGVTVTFTANGTQYVSFFAKQGTATGFMFGIFDTGGAGYRALISVTWSGLTTAVTSGSATVYTPISVGASWYLFRASIPSIVAANTNQFRLYATLVTGSLTGTTSFYLRNTAVVAVIDNVLRTGEKGDDHEVVVGTSGVADAWAGLDWYTQSHDLRHIPDHDTSSPGNCTGFDGVNEYTGVNCGFDAMLKAGRNKTSLLYVPDSADCTTYITSEMVEPMSGGVSLEDTNPNYRRIHQVIRNTTQVYAGWV